MIIYGNSRSGYAGEITSYVVATGSANAYAVTLDPAITAYAAGLRIRFQANFANTGATTLNVNGLGAVAIRKNVSTALAGGEIGLNQIVDVVYDGTNFQMSIASTGPQGTGGSSGSSGVSGSSGNTGSSGTSGQNGSSGSSGVTVSGSSGTSGVTVSGSSGTSGATVAGSSGTSGNNGTSGSSGTSGNTGTSGTSGNAGSSGTSGNNGSSGSSGQTGGAGTSGTSGSGSPGTSGTSGNSVALSGGSTNYYALWSGASSLTTGSLTEGVSAVSSAKRVDSSNGFYVGSSRYLKTEITPFVDSALDLLDTIDVVSYKYKNDLRTPKVGFIAEDTLPIFSTPQKNMFDQANTVGVLIRAVQELRKEINNIKTRLDGLE